MSIFTQKINPMTGTSEWVLKDEHYDYFQEIARSAFADMLHDTERNQKYFQAIQDAVSKMKATGKKAHVLDIGTGTGLLSMMAVKSGADSVIACEAFNPMSQCALKIIKDNHFELDIKVISKRSTELTVGEDGDLKHRANILVTEVFDTELIGEGALSTFQHAYKELLTEDCIVVPSSGTIYAQVVESPLVQNWNILKSVANSDGEILLNTPDTFKKCPGSVNVHDIQLSQLPINSFNTIISPTPVFRFNWSKDLQFDETDIKILKAERDGVAHAVFVWWDLVMDTESKIILSCAPYWAHPDRGTLIQKSPNTEFKQDLIPWRDHWMQSVYYLPQNGVRVQKNEEVSLISCHDEYSLWFNFKKGITSDSTSYLRPVCECLMHIACSRTRIGQINDGKRNKKYLTVLEDCINSKSICLSINDGSLLSLSMLKIGAKHLYCLERDIIKQKLLRSYAEFNNVLDRLTIIEKLSDLKKEEINQIQLVFSEPYFLTSLLPWDNFQYYMLLKEIREHLPNSVTFIPLKGTIKAVAVEFLDLHKIRAPLGDCEGFIMDKFDKLIDLASKLSDFAVEPHPLWEYPCKALSEPFQIYELDFSIDKDVSFPEIIGEIDLIGIGKCNGVALWVDWDLNGNRKNVISTGPISEININQRIVWDMHTRQGVYLMPKAKTLAPNTKLQYKVSFNNETKVIDFSFKKIKNLT